jgi:predicted nicotinamide N-methyase
VLSWEVDRVHGEPVWPAANLLCCFLASDRGVRACAGKRVLEVGAGVGLTGLVAAHFARY